MKLYQLMLHDEAVVAVETDHGLIHFTGAFQAYNFLHANRLMLKLATIKEFLLYPGFSDDLIAAVLDFLESHNLWNQYSITTEYKILPPILNPGKIIAIGLNYAKHAAEGGRDVPTEPIFFTKASSVVIGQDEPIQLPPDVGRVDHELELAVVIGKEASRVKTEEAESFIAGYTVFNDVTAREMQRQDKSNQLPWFRSKNFDTFAPMGPCLVTAADVDHPISLEMELRVNGEVRQKSNSLNMVFKVPQLISTISNYLTLNVGDVIATGTPEGISEIHGGDAIEAEIEKIGILRNHVVNKSTG
jgi:5-oxopent-3-ene-1,2,5-tricarboxylate decarboxylase/2-hydroxyhepta-2,4-diene-1,7-dioate isomerase